MLTRAALVAIAAIVLCGCTQTAPPAGAPAPSRPSFEASPTATSASVASAQPDPLIDLRCSDFAQVVTIGTLAGVTERDARAALADLSDVVPLADIVRNAGGVACEFSDGGSWLVTGTTTLPFNESWRGAAIYVLPNAASVLPDLSYGSLCGDSSTNTTYTVCEREVAVGSSWVKIVSSSNDRGTTLDAVRDFVVGVVSAATARPGPIERPEGTYIPDRDCETLAASATMAAQLGVASVVVDRAVETDPMSEATYLTEHVGCAWYDENSSDLLEAIVYPGGAWAAELTLPGIASSPLELDGLGGTDSAVTHCTPVPQYDYVMCWAEVVTDGSWIRAFGDAADESTALARAVAVAQAVLTARD